MSGHPNTPPSDYCDGLGLCLKSASPKSPAVAEIAEMRNLLIRAHSLLQEHSTSCPQTGTGLTDCCTLSKFRHSIMVSLYPEDHEGGHDGPM